MTLSKADLRLELKSRPYPCQILQSLSLYLKICQNYPNWVTQLAAGGLSLYGAPQPFSRGCNCFKATLLYL